MRDETLRDWLVTLEGHLLAADADAVPARDAAVAVLAILRRHLGEEACRRMAGQVLPELGYLLDAA